MVLGRKYEEKLYRWHSGYPGGMKSTTPRRLAEDKNRPEEILVKAVKGMLPKNKLRLTRLQRFYVFPDEEHTFKDWKFDFETQPPKRYDLNKYFK